MRQARLQTLSGLLSAAAKRQPLAPQSPDVVWPAAANRQPRALSAAAKLNGPQRQATPQLMNCECENGPQRQATTVLIFSTISSILVEAKSLVSSQFLPWNVELHYRT